MLQLPVRSEPLPNRWVFTRFAANAAEIQEKGYGRNMRYINRVNYCKKLFVEIYREEVKKVMLILRIVTGLGILVAAYMLIREGMAGIILPGDVFNLILSAVLFILVNFIPQFAARRQIRKCRKRGLDGEHVLHFTDEMLTMKYMTTGKQIDIPLNTITAIKKVGNYFKLTINGRSTYLDIDGFQMGEANDFFLFAEEKAEESAEIENAKIEEAKASIHRKARGWIADSSYEKEEMPEEEELLVESGEETEEAADTEEMQENACGEDENSVE